MSLIRNCAMAGKRAIWPAADDLDEPNADWLKLTRDVLEGRDPGFGSLFHAGEIARFKAAVIAERDHCPSPPPLPSPGLVEAVGRLREYVDTRYDRGTLDRAVGVRVACVLLKAVFAAHDAATASPTALDLPALLAEAMTPPPGTKPHGYQGDGDLCYQCTSPRAHPIHDAATAGRAGEESDNG